MEIIKTKRLKEYDVTLIYFNDIREYEVQVSKKPYNKITDTDGTYSTKRAGLQVYKKIIKEIINGEYK